MARTRGNEVRPGERVVLDLRQPPDRAEVGLADGRRITGTERDDLSSFALEIRLPDKVLEVEAMRFYASSDRADGPPAAVAVMLPPTTLDEAHTTLQQLAQVLTLAPGVVQRWYDDAQSRLGRADLPLDTSVLLGDRFERLEVDVEVVQRVADAHRPVSINLLFRFPENRRQPKS